jgi:streptogramin lyase
VNFGAENVGSTSPVIPLIFTFDSAGSIAAPVVLTQGVAGPDFADTGTGTCTNGPGRYYNAGDTCTVDVTFTPGFAGTRYGAAELQDGSGNVIATGYVQGTGTGPLVNFLPGVQSTIVSSPNVVNRLGVAMDGSGNLYIADSSHQRVVKETPSNGTYTQSTIASTSPATPSHIAVDGAGCVYIHTSSEQIWKETPSGSGYAQSTVATNKYVLGMAVDGSGNVYLTDYLYNRVLKETLSAGIYIESIVPTSGLNDAFGIAADGSGNIYIADPNNLRVVTETFSAGQYTQSTLPTSGLTNDAQWIAVDALNNIYIADFGTHLVLKETPSGGSYTQSTIPVSGLGSPAGVAIDGGRECLYCG